LRSILKRAEVTVSLRTGRFAFAARAARAIKVGLDAIMSAVEQGLPTSEIERRVRAWIADLALEYGAQLAASDGLSGLLTAQETEGMGPDQATEIDRLLKLALITEAEPAKRALVQAASGTVVRGPAIDRLVAAAAAQMKLAFAPLSPAAKDFRMSVLRNLPALIDASAAMAKGGPIPDAIMAWFQAPAPLPASPEEPALVNAGKPISQLWVSFCSSKVDGNAWKVNERTAAKTTLKLWIEINGDDLLGNYTTLNVEEFRSVYRKLPSDYYHDKQWKFVYETSGVRALADFVKPTDTKLTDAKTWNKHLSRLNECWRWATEKGQAIPKGVPSIFEGFFIPIPKNRIGRRMKIALRAKYDDQQIRKMLSAPLFLGCRSQRRWKESGNLVFRNHRYWMILLGLLQGMRREEPLILKVKHVKAKKAIWYFDLLDEEIVPLLKDIGSPRWIPLHKDLIKLDFLGARVFGRSPEARLFPEAVSYSQMKRRGDPFGKWFTNFRRSCGIVEDKYDFHSARHSVVSRLLDEGVPEAHVEELCGHEGEERRSELSTYDHGRRLKILQEAIDKLELPVDCAAMREAVLISDRFDPSAANPPLDDPAIVPKPRKRGPIADLEK
jgi:integrase